MSEDEKIKPKDIYESLWRCRDFELSHLWQRSIFLTAFLVMCFTGYGAVILEVCKGYATESPSFYILNLIAIIITLLGYVLSILWVQMSKGSKAWYEKYEKAIYEIERNEKYSQQIVVQEMDNDHVMHGSLPPPHTIQNSLLSTDAGKYSVSRINIIIGQVCMILWCVLYLVTSSFFSFSSQIQNITGTQSWVVCIIILVSFAILLSFVYKCIAGQEIAKSSGI